MTKHKIHSLTYKQFLLSGCADLLHFVNGSGLLGREPILGQLELEIDDREPRNLILEETLKELRRLGRLK